MSIVKAVKVLSGWASIDENPNVKQVEAAGPVKVIMAGAPGPRGFGVPVGGTAGQILAKIDGVDYNDEWVDPYSLPNTVARYDAELTTTPQPFKDGSGNATTLQVGVRSTKVIGSFAAGDVFTIKGASAQVGALLKLTNNSDVSKFEVSAAGKVIAGNIFLNTKDPTTNSFLNIEATSGRIFRVTEGGIERGGLDYNFSKGQYSFDTVNSSDVRVSTTLIIGSENDGAYISIGADFVVGKTLLISNKIATDVGLTLKGAASQSGNMLEIRNSADTEKLLINQEGIVDYRGTMADSSKDPTTDAPSDWVEIKIAGAQMLIPAYPLT